MAMTSAAGLLSLITGNSNPDVQGVALERLYPMVDTFWVEIADVVYVIEALSEDPQFPKHELASALASKCFYHLEEYSQALRLALSAGDYFDISVKSQYTDTMLARSIDCYIKAQKAAQQPESPSSDSKTSDADTDEADVEAEIAAHPRLATIISGMFEQCFSNGSFKQALGIALEARRVDMVRESIDRAKDKTDMLAHAYDVCQAHVSDRKWRREVLRTLADIYDESGTRDYVSLCNCLQALDDHSSVATLLDKLIRSDNEDEALLAFQAAFDLCENENQQFSLSISRALPKNPFTAAAATAASGADASTQGMTEEQMMENIQKSREELAAQEGGESSSGAEPSASDGATEAAAAAAAAAAPDFPEDHIYWERLKRLRSILVDGLAVRLYLQFLYKNNKADIRLLTKIRDALPERSSVCHSACVAAHGYMYCGTTIDTFLRKNMQWLAKASNWAKFNAIGSLGVVYKGYVSQSRTLLADYLSEDGAMSTRPYQEGGALYALGLIHANKGGQGDQDILKYLRDHLQAAAANQNETASEVIQHGACLGLGLAAMGTSNAEIFEQLKNVLYSDRAVAGEAAAVSMGLLALGSASSNVLNQMIRYAHQTKHEKIIRGLGLAMALTMFGQEQGADTLISQLVSDNDPILRCSAMWTTAAAYAGTSSNAAIRRLLHISVSDVDNDVRRTAVMCLGFVMLRTPELVPRLVALLAESYNPHVRYGACMAIGIACAGKPTKEALDLLCSMLDDKVSFVKQGALLSLALVLTQEHEARTPRVKMLREKIMSIVGDKHQSVVSKFGATLAAGILDAGGRNMCVNMISGAGFLRQGAVVGMIVWLHHWYWYPYLQFLSLALKPTAVIGVNKDMKIPEKFRMTCLCRPSLFAYPEMLKEDKEEKKERVKAAVLSTTAKAKAKKVMRDQKSEEGGDVEMSTDNAAAAGTGASASTEGDSKSDDASDAEAGSKKEGDDAAAAAAKTKKPEPKFFTLQNPSRVTYAQQRYLKYDEGNRYRPVHSKTKRNLGVVVLTDTTPGEADDELQDIEEPPKHGDVSDEPAPPEPFVWTPPAPADSEK